jgi:hypothetical protein
LAEPASAAAAPAPAPASAPTGPVESEAVAARFPDPAVRYATPAFEPGHTGFTSNAELRSFVHRLVRDEDGAGSTGVRLLPLGSSQTGIPLEALQFSRAPVALAATGATASPPRPTVLLIGQQHGDEPAGAEALLAVAQELAQAAPGGLAGVLERIDVVILPRANPDGAASGMRLTASGIDANRDHLLLRTPEAQAIAQLMREFQPLVVVDAHEYPTFGPGYTKFGALPRSDVLFDYATAANVPEFVTRAAREWFRAPLLQAFKAQGLTSEWYHTTTTEGIEKRVSMGGVEPDNGRNVAGLRNAVSLLIETRGGPGLGRAHFARRVHTQVTAIASVLRSAAARADDLAKLRRYVDAEVTGRACRGQVVVEATTTPSEYRLLMLDPTTGADKPVTVTWDSALELNTLTERPRPCGYWLGSDQADAALRLRGLGLRVQRIDEDGDLRGELYGVTAREVVGAGSAGPDAGVAEGSGPLKLKVDRVPALIDVRAGGYYVGLDQPLANLAVAALEPDTRHSYASHRVVSDVNAEARVLGPPDLRMTPLP